MCSCVPACVFWRERFELVVRVPDVFFFQARFGEIKPKRKAPPRQNKIDHLVVLYMENHASDNFFGCMDLPGYDIDMVLYMWPLYSAANIVQPIRSVRYRSNRPSHVTYI